MSDRRPESLRGRIGQHLPRLSKELGARRTCALLPRTDNEIGLAAAGQKVRIGMEASGQARWFEQLLAELQIELWIGDAAEIRTRRVRKQDKSFCQAAGSFGS